MNRDYNRAGRCFALARSTTFAGERESAIRRGTEIAEKAGISLDEFDIPGRVRSAPRRDPFGFGFERTGFDGTNFRYGRTTVAADDLMRALNEAFTRSLDMHRAVEAERAARRQVVVDGAVDFLRARGCVVRRVEGGYTLDGVGIMEDGLLMEAGGRGFRYRP